MISPLPVQAITRVYTILTRLCSARKSFHSFNWLAVRPELFTAPTQVSRSSLFPGDSTQEVAKIIIILTTSIATTYYYYIPSRTAPHRTTDRTTKGEDACGGVSGGLRSWRLHSISLAYVRASMQEVAARYHHDNGDRPVVVVSLLGSR